MMEFNQFVMWAFLGLLSGSIVYFASILKDVKDSLLDLNVKLAVILEKSVHHEKRLDKHEVMIDAILQRK